MYTYKDFLQADFPFLEGSAIQITKENEKMASCFVSKLFGREISELYTDFLIFVLYKMSAAAETNFNTLLYSLDSSSQILALIILFTIFSYFVLSSIPHTSIKTTDNSVY